MSTANLSTSSSKSEKFIFECDQHATNISEKLLKFYEAKDFFDTVLIASNDCIKIPAHKIVLSALSEFFLKQFRSSAPTSAFKEVKLKEIEASTLKLIVDYMYSGSIELNLENIDGLLRSAVFLKMKHLIDGCCGFLETNLNIGNCLHWLCVAKLLSLSGLQEICLKFIYKHFEEVTIKSEFLLLNENVLKDLLFNDNSPKDLEEQVFLGLVNWIEYPQVDRQNLLFELLSRVRYQFLTPEFIFKNRISVCNTVENCELILRWLEYHMWPESRTIEEEDFHLSSEPDLEPKKELNSSEGEDVGKVAVIYLNDQYEAEIRSYNQSLNKWSIEKRSHPLGKPKSHHSMLVIDDKLLVVGGITSGNKTTNSVESLDMKTLIWTELPPMGIARCDSQLATLNGHLCVFGGFEDSNNTNFIDSVEIFNFSTRKWNFLEPQFKPTTRNKIIGHNGTLYICDFYYGRWQCYDISSNRWTTKAQQIDDNVWDLRISAVGNVLYCCLVGDYTVDENNSWVTYKKIRIKCFDLTNDTWCDGAEFLKNYAMVRSVTRIGNKVLVQTDCIREYNTDTAIFTELSGLGLGSYFRNLCIFSFKI